MQNKDHLIEPTRPVGRTSLGLSTPFTFQLQLLEIAVKGKNAFENFLNKECPKYGIDEQVMSLEILQEIKLWENGGNRNLLLERVRDQVVRMKDHKSLHKRALVTYRDFLNLSLARSQSYESTDTQSSQCRTCESTELTWSTERVSSLSREYTSSSPACTIDEKLEQMLTIVLPETVDEESFSYVEDCSRAQGELSGSSCDTPSLFGGASCEELSIFEMPENADEGVFTPGAQKFTTAEESEGCDSILSLGCRNSHWPKVYSNMTPRVQEQDFFSCDVSDVKIDLGINQIPKALGNFTEKGFKYPIQWTIDGITYKARNESELRSKHDIVTEGIFKKRFKCHTWRSYYGFFFNTGVMVYFRNAVFKKAADFRKSTVTIPKGKEQRLNIHEVHVASRVISWHLKFDNAKHRNTWCNTIVKFSKVLTTEIDGKPQSVDSPMNRISMLI